MSQIQGKVGTTEVTWLDAPKGPAGHARVRVGSGPNASVVDVRWRRDREGLWLEFPDRVLGYDIHTLVDDDGVKTYSLWARGAAHAVQGVAFRRAGEEALAGSGAAKKGLKIKSQMPGKILRVLVNEGDEVRKDQPVLVMEAMKMENEIRSPQAGKVAHVWVTQGQNVETGSPLLGLE